MKIDKRTKELKDLATKAHRWEILYSQIKEVRKSKKSTEQEMGGILFFFSRKGVLAPRDFKILKERIIDSKTLQELAKILGISKERVHQLEAKALEKIKRYCVNL